MGNQLMRVQADLMTRYLPGWARGICTDIASSYHSSNDLSISQSVYILREHTDATWSLFSLSSDLCIGLNHPQNSLTSTHVSSHPPPTSLYARALADTKRRTAPSGRTKVSSTRTNNTINDQTIKANGCGTSPSIGVINR